MQTSATADAKSQARHHHFCDNAIGAYRQSTTALYLIFIYSPCEICCRANLLNLIVNSYRYGFIANSLTNFGSVKWPLATKGKLLVRKWFELPDVNALRNDGPSCCSG